VNNYSLEIMKTKITLGAIVISIVLQVNLSCKKERSCEGCNENNKPPMAIAGPDQVITLPTDSVLLDGRSSNDADGYIKSYHWRKISGPASFNINSSADSATIVKSLTAGVYHFELKVTDNGNLSALDTLQVIVNDPSQPNHPPVANAGADQTITLPVNDVIINGSGSSDPDNNITTYLWSKISGPQSFSISNASNIQSHVTNLVQGVYYFELKVTDAGGLFSKDTMQVMVNDPPPQVSCIDSNRTHINAQLIPVGNLSKSRTGMSVASAGNKIVFAGGNESNGFSAFHSSRVDIYDISTNTWSIAELCVARDDMAAIASGNKIFFGGGEVGDGTWPVDSVDIYDVTTNTWTVAHLSTAGHSIAAASVGNKVFFAGGDHGFNGTPGLDRAKQVDIYDIATNTWSTSQLSNSKVVGHCAVTAGNKIYFSGGETWQGTNPVASNVIDIYDEASNSWSTSSLLENRLGHTGIVIADKIYWAGGTTGCSVEIKDILTGSTSIQHLFKPGFWWQGIGQQAVIKNNKIIFLRHYDIDSAPDKFDIYDVITNTWAIGVLPFDIELFSVISINNTIYIAGGAVNGVVSEKVYKLEF
jgi:hypothetical protein